MAQGFSTKRPETKQRLVVSVPNNQDDVDRLLLHISAYAGEVPEDVADLLWQVHRKLNT